MPTFDLDAPLYTGRSFSFTAQDGNPMGFCFSPDGLLLFMAGRATRTVYKYTLTAPFDFTTAVYSGQSFYVDDAGTIFQTYYNQFNLKSVRISADGTKLFVSDDRLYILRFDLNVPFDLTTASYFEGTGYNGRMRLPTATGSEIVLGDGGFDYSESLGNLVAAGPTSANNYYYLCHRTCPNSDGVTGAAASETGDGSLSLSNASSYATEFPSAQADYAVSGIRYANSGKYVFICDSLGVHKVELYGAAPYYFDNVSREVREMPFQFADISKFSAELSGVVDLYVSPAGTSMLLLSDTGTLYEYNLTRGVEKFDLDKAVFSGVQSPAAAVELFNQWPADGYDNDGFSRANSFDFSPDGRTLTVYLSEIDTGSFDTSYKYLAKYILDTPFDISSVSSAEFIYKNGINSGIFWGNTGGKLYYKDNGNNIASLSTSAGYDVLSITPDPAVVESSQFGSSEGNFHYQDSSGQYLGFVDNYLARGELKVRQMAVPFDIASVGTTSVRVSDVGQHGFWAGDSADERLVSVLEVQNEVGTRIRTVAVTGGGNLVQTSLKSYSDKTTSKYWTEFKYRNIFSEAGMLQSPVADAKLYEGGRTLMVMLENMTMLKYTLPVTNQAKFKVVELLSGTPVNLGILSEDTTAQLLFINNATSDNIVVSISGPTNEVSFTNLQVGTVIPAGLEHSAQITVPKGIARDVDLTFTVTFDNSSLPVEFKVIFNKPNVWALPPSWDKGIPVQYDWATSVTKSLNSLEKRRKLRSYPRASFKVSHLLGRSSAQRVMNSLRFMSEVEFMLPEWMFEHKLQSAVAAGDSLIPVDNSRGLIKAGDYVVVTPRGYAEQYRRVRSAEASSLLLFGGFDTDLPAGVSLYPATTCNIGSNVSVKTITRDVVELSATFKTTSAYSRYQAVAPSWDTHSSEGGVPLPVLPYFDKKSENGQGLTITTPRHSLSTSTSADELVELVYNDLEMGASGNILLYGSSEIDEFFRSAFFLSGRYNDFWAPLDFRSVYMVSDATIVTSPNPATYFDVEDNGLLSGFAPEKHGSIDLLLETDGTPPFKNRYTLSVTSITQLSAGVTRLGIDGYLETSSDVLGKGMARRLSLLVKATLLTDKLQCRWMGPNLVEVTVSVKKVHNLTTALLQ